jgi:hypothetical protein
MLEDVGILNKLMKKMDNFPSQKVPGKSPKKKTAQI